MADEPVKASEKQKFWQDRIMNALKREAVWRAEGDFIVDRYRLETFRDDVNKHSRAVGTSSKTTDSALHSAPLNILWSNTETLKPAVLSQIPEPDVRRRKPKGAPDQGEEVRDKAKREAAEIIEGCLRFYADEPSFAAKLRQQRDDMLLPGRGVVRVRYEAEFTNIEMKRISRRREDENGMEIEEQSFEAEFGDEMIAVVNPTGFLKDANISQGFVFGGEKAEDEEDTTPFFEIKTNEKVFLDYVYWKDFIMSDSRNWEDVWWLAYRHIFSDKEMSTKFGKEKLDTIFPVTMADDEASDSRKSDLPDGFKEVWEIWDKKHKKRIWTSLQGMDILKIEDDPLGLKNFFDCTKPLYPYETTNTMIPVPLYDQYRSQAEELDVIEKRIKHLETMMKVAGVYDGAEEATIIDLASSGDGQFIPAKTFGTFQGQGLKASMVFLPLQEIAGVIQELRSRRGELIQEIFEITGISDLQRGVSDPSTSATAEALKGDLGTRRLRNYREPMEENIREVYEIMAEMISELFEPTTMARITEITPGIETLKLMKTQSLREVRIDIETDSTSQPFQALEQQKAVQFMTAMTNSIATLGPIIQQEPLLGPMFGEMLKTTVRRFKAGRSMETVIDETIDSITQQQQPQEQEQEGMPDQIELAKLEIEKQKLILKNKEIDAKLAIAQIAEETKRGQIQVESQDKALDREIEIEKELLDIAAATAPVGLAAIRG